MREIPYSMNEFDQKRLAKAGGKIVIKKNGALAFAFDTAEQFKKYLELNQYQGGKIHGK